MSHSLFILLENKIKYFHFLFFSVPKESRKDSCNIEDKIVKERYQYYTIYTKSLCNNFCCKSFLLYFI